MYIHKKTGLLLLILDSLVNILAWIKNDYGNSFIFYAWFLAPKIKYYLVFDVFVVLSASRTFKGYSEEHRMIKLIEFVSLSEGKTVSGKFLTDWTKRFERIKTPQRTQDCLECDNGKTFSDCVLKPKTNCETETTCEACLETTNQKKTYSADIKMFKTNSAKENYQMLPYYINEYKPKRN